MNRKEKEEIINIAKKVIPKLKLMEDEFGGNAVRYAMRKYLTQFSEENKRRTQIAKLERELASLKKKELR